jgi:tyrosine-protein kinase Etk/Wzc
MQNNSSNNSTEENIKARSSFINTEFDPFLFFQLLKQNLIWFCIIIVVCIVCVFIYLRYTSPVYESNLVFQVGSINTANRVLDVNDFQERDDLAKDIEILKSKLLFKRALKTIPLDVSYYNKGDILTFELYKSTPIKVEYDVKDSSILGTSFFVEFKGTDKFILKENSKVIGEFDVNEKIHHPKVDLIIRLLRKENFDYQENLQDGSLYFTINDFEHLTNSYISRLTVYPINNSAKTISISFKDNNHEKTADIVTAIANEYVNYDIEERSKSSKKALQFIDDQLDKYYNKVKNSENRIQEFQEGNGYTTLDRSSAYFDRSNKLENELIDIDLQKTVLTEIKNSLALNLNNIDVYELLPILAGTEYATGIMSLITTLKELLIEKENIQFEVTKDSEIIKSLNHKIEVQKKVLQESINSSIVKLNVRRTEILSKIKELESKFLSVPAKDLEYARLQRVLSIDEKFFTLLMEKRTEYSISDAGFVSQHTILDKAIVPSSPVYPNKKYFILLGIVVGIALSLILLLTKYLLKTTISSIDDIIKYSNVPLTILGIVPKYKHDIPVSQLIVNKNPKSVIAESFRVLRTNLQFISEGTGKKLLAITSTVSGEGKTFCAINIGGIIAYSGKKVVILDLDMRKPKIHIGFGVGNDIGMSTLLIGKAEISECIHHSELDGLDFITSGPVPPNPSELIINGKLDIIIKELQNKYDLVIVDNPPIGLVSDAMELLKKADYPIYVFKNEYSKKYFINNVDQLIVDNGIKKLSIILNSVETIKKSYRGGYGGAYGYGGYYEDEPVSQKSFINKMFGRKS